jgi:hypothetical protein
MYKVRHTKAADAAAEILMRMGHSWWWIHADEDEGFRMARMNSPEGDRLARSGSPCLVGPYSANVSLFELVASLSKAQGAESSKRSMGIRTPFHERDFEGPKKLRENIMQALDAEHLTMPQMADLFQVRIEDVKSAIRLLIDNGKVVRDGVAKIGYGGKLHYWRKVA